MIIISIAVVWDYFHDKNNIKSLLFVLRDIQKYYIYPCTSRDDNRADNNRNNQYRNENEIVNLFQANIQGNFACFVTALKWKAKWFECKLYSM